MSEDFVVNAQVRADAGKGASRRLRRLENLVPAIIYGGDTAPVNLSIAQNKLSKALENDAFYSSILTVKYDGNEDAAILKDLQRHPSKGFITHADFQRVSKDKKIHVHVPLHFINEESCKGVKLGGGIITHQMVEVEVVCLPGQLPEFIEVDMAALELDDIVHLSDLKLPEGVVLAALSHGPDHDLPVANVHQPRGAKEDTDADGGDSAEGESEA